VSGSKRWTDDGRLNTEGDQITISTATRHGRQKRHTFYWGRNAEWVTVPVLSTKQKRERARWQSQQSPGNEPPTEPTPRTGIGGSLIVEAAASPTEPWRRPPPRMPLGDRPYISTTHGSASSSVNQRLRDYTTVHLADGVDPSASALAVILNAVRSGRRREVDLHDVKVVLSQLGSRITRLEQLPADTRGHAEQALYTEILDRCTMVS
jgi:hypothetical protein